MKKKNYCYKCIHSSDQFKILKMNHVCCNHPDIWVVDPGFGIGGWSALRTVFETCDHFMQKPIFIPLKKEYFEAYERGEKDTEYRPYGKRWNEKTCPIGREVVLSCGYGKSRRLKGRVAGFGVKPVLSSAGGAAFMDCYGKDHPGPIAEIKIVR